MSSRRRPYNDGYALARLVPSHEGRGAVAKVCTPRSDASFEVHRKSIDGFHLAANSLGRAWIG